ncbi:NUDIX hydrolase [Agrobacterium larrymoorei]|uniref:NUDIX hydrolase n=1 Tax=Agrobacterium larrymoorei TaxID=160699 RepID=A0A4D7E636_9HYPH|nr:NUDIX hydrolase [Agrobacterium larrymoorei]QCJ00761.1 NUDIX hydrolase [Agrobacterium larrymoorei]QYA10764.1 NUDIX hydrolase [Agrobacterium larrymoorei]
MKAVTKGRKATKGNARPLLKQLAAMPDKLFAGKFRQQLGALCYRKDPDGAGLQILLVTSRGTGRWVIPKGWPMKKKKPHEAAQTEAWEEAGVRGRAKKKPVGSYTYLKWMADGDVAPCVVDVYQVEVTEISEDFKERGQRQLIWVTPEEASRRVREVELKSLLIDFRPAEK